MSDPPAGPGEGDVVAAVARLLVSFLKNAASYQQPQIVVTPPPLSCPPAQHPESSLTINNELPVEAGQTWIGLFVSWFWLLTKLGLLATILYVAWRARKERLLSLDNALELLGGVVLARGGAKNDTVKILEEQLVARHAAEVRNLKEQLEAAKVQDLQSRQHLLATLDSVDAMRVAVAEADRAKLALDHSELLRKSMEQRLAQMTSYASFLERQLRPMAEHAGKIQQQHRDALAAELAKADYAKAQLKLVEGKLAEAVARYTTQCRENASLEARLLALSHGPEGSSNFS